MKENSFFTPIGSNYKGTEWTLSATGDYAPLPQISELISLGGLDELINNIKTLTQADISITNLEVGLCSKEKLDGYGVRADRELFKQFHNQAPFTVYSFANNHICDAGRDELKATFEFFNKENILYVGGGDNSEIANRPLFIQQGEVKVGILAFAQNENQIADINQTGANELLFEKVIIESKKLISQCDVPIIIMHDGFEFMDIPRIQFKDLCHDLIKLGIKVVIGHHSHVPQGIEQVDNSIIFYSLGNFLFDQPHFKPYEWSRKSFVPKLTFKGKDIVDLEIKTFIINTDPLMLRLTNEKEHDNILEKLKQNTKIISDKKLINAELENFYTKILMPEFFKFIREYGEKNDNDFSEIIEKFKKQVTVHNLFEGFLKLYKK